MWPCDKALRRTVPCTEAWGSGLDAVCVHILMILIFYACEEVRRARMREPQCQLFQLKRLLFLNGTCCEKFHFLKLWALYRRRERVACFWPDVSLSLAFDWTITCMFGDFSLIVCSQMLLLKPQAMLWPGPNFLTCRCLISSLGLNPNPCHLSLVPDGSVGVAHRRVCAVMTFSGCRCPTEPRCHSCGLERTISTSEVSELRHVHWCVFWCSVHTSQYRPIWWGSNKKQRSFYFKEILSSWTAVLYLRVFCLLTGVMSFVICGPSLQLWQRFYFVSVTLRMFPFVLGLRCCTGPHIGASLGGATCRSTSWSGGLIGVEQSTWWELVDRRTGFRHDMCRIYVLFMSVFLHTNTAGTSGKGPRGGCIVSWPRHHTPEAFAAARLHF